ncbi:sugar phosphate isomerase/epimerase [Microbacterium sp.]|uniref:sugar phosphate isomerase/epimerase family protein n=1 Tax=Microbacterium sp. TaxID=51671 RepID=UPI003221BAA1
MPFDPDLVICSTITLRHLPLEEALTAIAAEGFTAVDLGALPGVCDHVPVPLDDEAVAQVAETVRRSGLSVVSVNADVGDLNRPLSDDEAAARRAHVDRLVALCTAVGARALVLPNGRQDHEPFVSAEADTALVAAELERVREVVQAAGLELWVEAPHLFRLHHTVDGSAPLYDQLDPRVGAVCDVSHIVASGGTVAEFARRFGPRIAHVHIRDAEPGYIHHSVGRGTIDFAAALAALADAGYRGVYSLELETRDVANDDRARVAHESADLITAAHPEKGTA